MRCKCDASLIGADGYRIFLLLLKMCHIIPLGPKNATFLLMHIVSPGKNVPRSIPATATLGEFFVVIDIIHEDRSTSQA